MQVAPTLVPLLKFYFHEEVRKAAVSGLQMTLDYFLLSLSILDFSNLDKSLDGKHLFFVCSHAGATAFCKISCGEGASSRS